MLRAMKQRALSASVADSVTSSARDSPTISLCGKGRTLAHQHPVVWATGVEVALKSLVLAVKLTSWKQGFPLRPSCVGHHHPGVEQGLRMQCKLEGGQEVQGRALASMEPSSSHGPEAVSSTCASLLFCCFQLKKAESPGSSLSLAHLLTCSPTFSAHPALSPDLSLGNC